MRQALAASLQVTFWIIGVEPRPADVVHCQVSLIGVLLRMNTHPILVVMQISVAPIVLDKYGFLRVCTTSFRVLCVRLCFTMISSAMDELIFFKLS